jgi:aminoglycoside phosphotransferase (APT) family kinase protein
VPGAGTVRTRRGGAVPEQAETGVVVGAESSASALLGPELVEWIRDVTTAVDVRVERRSAGASRAGFAVDAELADGTTRELWLRMDTGVGPQSGTLYTLRREAAVYRALRDTPLRVARLVAVHPTAEAFLMERLEGRNWFSEIEDPAEQLVLASAFLEQLAALHRIDPRALDLPELGTVRTVGEHVLDELEEWESQYVATGGDDPLTTLAFVWLRRHLSADGDWPVVLVQGDTGPGNFMFRDGELVAVTDWEMAHFGDLHDDLGWIYVRDLQERFTHLPDRLREYEELSGFRIDRDRLRYFRVLAQLRCAVGTLNGVRARDRRGEIANHLIYHALHMRLLAEALADAERVAPEVAVLPDTGDGQATWAFDVALDEIRDVVVPNLTDGFAVRRAKGLARLLKFLREQDRLGGVLLDAELAELGMLGGRLFTDVVDARRTVCRGIEAHEIDETAALRYCLRQAARVTQVLRPAMGALADRHYSPIDDEEHTPWTTGA